MLISGTTGIVLLGGRSSRFGSNKSFALVDGVPLIERVTGVMGSLFHRVMLITNSPWLYSHLNLPMIEDQIKDLGPIGGLYTALVSIKTRFAFVTACDMPYLNGKLIRRLVEMADDFDVTVPAPGSSVEPLHAVYSKRCVPALKNCIDAGERRIIRFYPKANVKLVPEVELRKFDPDLKSLYNINRPQDLRET
jgi:molybdopterin-guanine dinucleotide biosynthesis protein A